MDAFLTFVWQLGNFTSSIYSENCIFEDPTIKFRGKNSCLLPTTTCMLLFPLCLAWPVFSSSAYFSSVTHCCYRKKKTSLWIVFNQLKLYDAW